MNEFDHMWEKVAALFRDSSTNTQIALANQPGRPGKTEFLNHWHQRNVPPAIAEAVREALTKLSNVPGFTPSWDDNLKDVYGLEMEDLEDFILQLVNQLNIGGHASGDSPILISAETVSDLVEFLASLETKG